MYKICVFAGTSEGRRLIELLSGQREVALTACVATEYGRRLLPGTDNLHILSGRLDREGMEGLLAAEKFCLVVDATHPYAREATKNIAGACSAAGTEYLRLLRGEEAVSGNAVTVPDADAAAAYLAATEGNILLTTGSKELARFAHI